MLNALISKYRRWKLVQKTEAELSALSNRELADIGVTRNDIRYIALHGGT